MKVTEIIDRLEQILHLHGDLDFCNISELDDMYTFDFGAHIEVMELEYQGEGKPRQIATVLPSTVTFDEDPREHLKVVK